uniref:Uncharacterized protein n=1 Tax=Ditylenchus dipsaci TaxID=166011 RepID=A0A915CY26_9BILA
MEERLTQPVLEKAQELKVTRSYILGTRIGSSAAELVQECKLSVSQCANQTAFAVAGDNHISARKRRIVASFQESELQERRVSFSDQQPGILKDARISGTITRNINRHLLYQILKQLMGSQQN